MSTKNKIFLVGMPGSGKSTIGKLLASRLGYTFIDLDDVVEGKANKKIAEIFEEKGEDYFRELEALSLTEVSNNNQDVVIATGGGAPCFHDGMEYINGHGISIYLEVPLETLTDRLSKASHRPLINQMQENEVAAGIKEKLSIREPVYLKASISIRNNQTANRVVNDIIEKIACN